jgi:hypothetical protein
MKPFFNAWYAYASERLIRHSDYLNEQIKNSQRTGHRGNAVLSLLDGRLDDLYILLADQFKSYRMAKEADIDDDEQTFFSDMRTFMQDFRSLHTYVRYLPLPWVDESPQIYLDKATDRLSPHVKERAPPRSIVLSSQYNFANVKPRSEAYRRASSILKLPAIEQHNPSCWPTLLHEFGHLVFNQSELHRSIMELPSLDNIPNHWKVCLVRWGEEIVCDLIATDIAGPSYLLSLCTFVALSAEAPLRRPSIDYPSANERFEYISARLKANCHDAWAGPAVQYAQQIWKYRLHLDNSDRTFRESQQDERGYVAKARDDMERSRYPSPEAVLTFANELGSCSYYADLGIEPYSQRDHDIAMELYAAVVNRRLIVTRRHNVNDSAVELAKMAATGADGRRTLLPEAVEKNYTLALRLLQEVPNNPVHIVNAGVLHQFDSIRPDGAERIVQDLDNSINESFSALARTTSQRFRYVDRILAKSIIDSHLAQKLYCDGPSGT